MKKFLGILGALASIVIILAAMGVGKFAGRAAVEGYIDDKNESALKSAADEANEAVPKMVDADTRLDRVFSGPGLRLTYEYTLINYPSDGQNPFDIFDNVENITAQLIRKVCTNSQMQPILASGTTVVYLYKDRNGIRIFDVEVAERKCNNVGRVEA